MKCCRSPVWLPEHEGNNSLIASTNNQLDPEVSLLVNKSIAVAKIDTAAKCNVMSLSEFKQTRNVECIASTSVILLAYGGRGAAHLEKLNRIAAWSHKLTN